jgi:deoxyadenosine/deoxycytidine kinase
MAKLGAPRFLVVEGPIGVGKTTLTRRLAQSLQGETLLEAAEENPFLERFYQNPKQAALPTQLFFLFQRARQLQELRQSDLFAPVRIADFMMEKDRLFAQLTLDDDELRLYDLAYNSLTLDVPAPDLVIYLQAPVDVLMSRVQKRGRSFEQTLDAAYLEGLVEAYTRFFHYYNETPLLIVNATEIDLVNNDRHYDMLLERVFEIRSGRHYFNPVSL